VTAETAKTRQPRDASAVLAIGFVLLAGLLYTYGYSLSKSLVNNHGLTAIQVTLLRCVLVLCACLAVAPWPRSGVSLARLLRPARAFEQRGAAAALVISNVLAVLAYGLMPVTAASALGFTAPLLLTALGGLMLGEKVSAARWLGAATGFAGMLLIVRPDESPALLGIVASVGAAAMYAFYQVLVRRLRAVANSLDTVMQVALVGVVLLAGTMVWFWRTMTPEAFALAVLVTVVQTTALFCIAAALRRGEASRLAPWQFSGLIWAMALDALMFGTHPSLASLAGGALVIAGGLLAQGGSGSAKKAG
jgi:drug/metabolite transporter (DMT)-like permease